MNPGAIATKDELKRRKLSVNKGAALVGCDPGTFSKILREKEGRRPGRDLAMRISTQLGIRPELWGRKTRKASNTKKRRNQTATE